MRCGSHLPSVRISPSPIFRWGMSTMRAVVGFPPASCTRVTLSVMASVQLPAFSNPRKRSSARSPSTTGPPHLPFFCFGSNGPSLRPTTADGIGLFLLGVLAVLPHQPMNAQAEQRQGLGRSLVVLKDLAFWETNSDWHPTKWPRPSRLQLLDGSVEEHLW